MIHLSASPLEGTLLVSLHCYFEVEHTDEQDQLQNQSGNEIKQQSLNVCNID